MTTRKQSQSGETDWLLAPSRNVARGNASAAAATSAASATLSLDTAAFDLAALVSAIARLDVLVKQLGDSSKDTASLRSEVASVHTNALEHARRVSAALKQPVGAADRARHNKLAEQFRTNANDLQTLSRALERAQRAHPSPAAFLDDASASSSAAAAAAGGRAADPFREQQLLDDGSVDVDAAIINETNQQWAHVQQELEALKDVFKDVGGMVHEQGEQLTQVEGTVTDASIAIEEGVVQLRTAESYQRSNRKKIAIIIGLFLCIFVTVVVVLLIFLKVEHII